MRLKFRKGDLLAILTVAILAAAVGLAFLPLNQVSQNAVVQIYQDGQLIQEIPLEQNEISEVAGSYKNTVEVRDGKAAIVQSDCPGEDCVHSGWINTAGRSIVCLPNRVEVRITGASEVDFVVG